jgi:hypothetical protein
MLVEKNTLSFSFNAKCVSGEELDEQLKMFVDIIETYGYKVTKKIIVHNNGYGFVDVEGKKQTK